MNIPTSKNTNDMPGLIIDIGDDCIDKLSFFDAGRDVIAIDNNGNNLKGTLEMEDSFFDGIEEVPVFIFLGNDGERLNLTAIQSMYFYTDLPK